MYMEKTLQNFKNQAAQKMTQMPKFKPADGGDGQGTGYFFGPVFRGDFRSAL